ncbi:E3 ubiquitin-protein ligase PDZRN3-B-like [Xyrauchen texanus]|uniref:E3 ubiquitin-protein ligase PDZRN3-B-like n=1 Tax=Xyrauchen texanus TaxID=154827 RepID=UPI002241D23E|nr:E3 ubiquitin-protein ligase PDZRN3-B-like [Xyrauchen texanus]
MGFDLERFESPVDPELICKLCGKVLEDPLTTPCGHVFCAACVLQWLSKSNICPVQCQKISTKELNHVLPLKNIILKLDIKCDHSERGCDRIMKLQHLPEHAEMCTFSPVTCRNKGCDVVVSLKDVASHLRDKCEYRPVVVCQDGCGLMLTLKEESEGHCCLRALQMRNGILLAKVQDLERKLKRQSLRFSNRESSLLSKLSALCCVLHMTAQSFQKKITEYKSWIDALSNTWSPLNQEQEDHGDLCDGIYISKVVENGAADKGGLQIHDRILEVNGKNLSHATHDQAVEAFQTAKGPIEVQVLRNTAHNKTFKNIAPTQGLDTSTQTNITLKCLSHIEAMAKLPSPPTPLGLAMLDSLLLPTESQMERCDSPYPPDFIDNIQKDTEARGLEYEIDPEGIAVKDGRVLQGDQIIQINGGDIQSHDEAVTLLTRVESKNVTLLVARSESQGDSWMEEDRNHFLDDLHIDMLEQQHHQAMRFSASMLQQNRHEEDGGTTDSATIPSNRHEKDSGVGRTDESTRNDESSEQEILGDDQNSACDTLTGNQKKFNYSQDAVGSGDMHLSNIDNGDSGNLLGISGMECEHFQELLELKCFVNGKSPFGFLEHDTGQYLDRVGLDSDEQEIKMLNEKLLNIKLECLSSIQAHRLNKKVEGQQPSSDSSSMHFTEQTSADKIHQELINKQVEKESSSAYNSGESCWSIPPALGLSSDSKSTVTADRRGSNPTTACLKHPLSPIQETSPAKRHPSSGDIEITYLGKRKQSEKRNPNKSLLTSSHHSPFKHNYIPAHAQHYQSYMQLIQQKSAVEYGHSQVSLASLCKNTEICPNDSRPKTEWKVKIRKDGTRYITKRPTRDQLLKERALRIREERSGITTDDDAVSVLKVGRYWSKQERKQHAARAKEQRQRRELIKQSYMESKEQAGALVDKKGLDIIQLSHKKMMRKRNKKIFDNWMTIQELLTHGMKSTDETRLYNSFLSVTTV